MGNYAYEIYKQAESYHYGWNGKKKDLTFDGLLIKARNGSEQSMIEVGLSYELGKFGMTVNKQEACNWYRMAARQGNANAKYRLDLLAKALNAENANEIGKALFKR